MAKVKKVKSIAKVKSFSELYSLAKAGDENYQKLCIVALNNLGCDHLANARHYPEKWRAYYNGLMEYVSALCCEYGESEDKAFRSVLAEVNNVRDCIDQVSLSWHSKK